MAASKTVGRFVLLKVQEAVDWNGYGVYLCACSILNMRFKMKTGGWPDGGGRGGRLPGCVV